MKRSAGVGCTDDAKQKRTNSKLREARNDGRVASCLPVEVLLNIVHCVDYNTLVALCFTSHSFHAVVQTNSGVLAKRLRMWLHFSDDKVVLYDDDTTLELGCDTSMPFTYVAAMRDVASHVGFHAIATLSVIDDWRRLPMDRLFYASRGQPSEGARKLPELVVAELCSIRRADGAISEPKEYDFLRYCFDLSRLAEGVGRFVQLPHAFSVSRSFLVTSLRRLAKADRTTTVQFRMAEEPNLSGDKFSTERMEQYERAVIRYKSRNSSISVYDLNGFFTLTNDPSFDPFVVD
ncbi:hypothetical protein AAVH_28427 [Aphelenchoides avenae]|nr:hypothetical protein AAVH_28427 [Aphelenchus avenae]